jgi:hypothetical protein
VVTLEKVDTVFAGKLNPEFVETGLVKQTYDHEENNMRNVKTT